MEMTEMKVRLVFTEEVLGTASQSLDLHKEFIASKAPDAMSTKEEVEALGVDEVTEKGRTVFPRTKDGQPMFWDYQIKGFFKDTCSALKRANNTESFKCKAYKKIIDGTIFIKERRIPISYEGEMGICSRPLRAQTMQGERVSIASSETIPEGSSVEFTIQMLNKSDLNLVKEWLDFGVMRGMGQWRNSGKGRFTWEEI